MVLVCGLSSPVHILFILSFLFHQDVRWGVPASHPRHHRAIWLYAFPPA